MTLILLTAGLILLLVGGDTLVRGSVAIAARFGVPPLVIGLTIVGFGTSLPELVASVQAALEGAPGVAVGNIVGSNIANILLILGVAAVILPVAASRSMLRRDGTVLLAASAAMVAIVLSGTLDRATGAVLVAGLCAYTIWSFLAARGTDDAAGSAAPRLVISMLYIAGGIVALVVGADLLVTSSVALARAHGLSEAVIGLTIVAVGTSLPELATSVVAAVRGQSGVALGNVLGSNIFNILGIAGVTALIAPIPIPEQIAVVDVWVMVGAAVLLVACAALARGVPRSAGLCLLALYAVYIAAQFSPGARAMLGL